MLEILTDALRVAAVIAVVVVLARLHLWSLASNAPPLIRNRSLSIFGEDQWRNPVTEAPPPSRDFPLFRVINRFQDGLMSSIKDETAW